MSKSWTQLRLSLSHSVCGNLLQLPQETTICIVYLEKFQITKYKDKELGKLSLGTKQKVVIIQSLLESVDVYIFDEPLNGLDDEAVKIFSKELQNLRKKQKLIIIIMHDDYRLKLLNKRVIRIDGGKVYFQINVVTFQVFTHS